MINVAIFASGNGQNAENLILKAKELSKINILFVLTDNKNAKVIERAKNLDVPVKVIPFKKISNIKYANRHNHENQIIEAIKSYNIDWIFLAGYMRILSSSFIKYFTKDSDKNSRIINIHPSLLPYFPGKNAKEMAYSANIRESGVTVHFVDEGVDTGKIIDQMSFSVDKNESFKSFCEKGTHIENILYPRVLQTLNELKSL